MTEKMTLEARPPFAPFLEYLLPPASKTASTGKVPNFPNFLFRLHSEFESNLGFSPFQHFRWVLDQLFACTGVSDFAVFLNHKIEAQIRWIQSQKDLVGGILAHGSGAGTRWS